MAGVRLVVASDRGLVGTATAIAVASAAAWAWLVSASDDEMMMELAGFELAWVAMMTAMMLPSAAPLVLLYARGAAARQRVELVFGYLAVWALIGLPVYAAQDVLPASAPAIAAVLAVAGVYQFTPLKDACLRTCRTPANFLMERWRRSAVRLGAEHGLYCVGCCWALMAVLVVAGAMGIAWAAGIAAIVFAEKVLPGGEWAARTGGVALLAAAALVVLV